MASPGTRQQAADWEKIALATENDRFKARYPVYIRWSSLISFVVALAVFLFTPEITIDVYTLQEEEIQVVDIPQNFDIPPPPVELPRPQVPIEAAPDAEVDEDIEIADTLPDDFDVPPPITAGTTGNDFIAYDTKPEIIVFVPPQYPEFAREASLEGVVVVSVQIGTDGRVMQAVIAQGAHNVLNEAALVAARKWVFTPGKQRDIPVPVWINWPLNFALH